MGTATILSLDLKCASPSLCGPIWSAAHSRRCRRIRCRPQPHREPSEPSDEWFGARPTIPIRMGGVDGRTRRNLYSGSCGPAVSDTARPGAAKRTRSLKKLEQDGRRMAPIWITAVKPKTGGVVDGMCISPR